MSENRTPVVRREFIILLPVLLAALVIGCSKTDTGATPPAEPQAASAYKLGTIITFAKGGDSERFRVSGWSHTEDDKTWSEGTSAKLVFTGLPTAQALRLDARVGALVQPPQLPSQPVEVYANGKQIATWTVSDNADFSAVIPADVNQDGKIELELKTPKATSPQALGQNNDARVLGVRMLTLRIDRSR